MQHWVQEPSRGGWCLESLPLQNEHTEKRRVRWMKLLCGVACETCACCMQALVRMYNGRTACDRSVRWKLDGFMWKAFEVRVTWCPVKKPLRVRVHSNGVAFTWLNGLCSTLTFRTVWCTMASCWLCLWHYGHWSVRPYEYALRMTREVSTARLGSVSVYEACQIGYARFAITICVMAGVKLCHCMLCC